MSTLKDRGLKRKCQNAGCARPFYDLNRAEFACPDCGTLFDLKAALQAQLDMQGRGYSRKPQRTFTLSPAVAEVDKAEPELADAELADDVVVDETLTDGDADQILETEEEDVEIEAIPSEGKDKDE